MSLKKLLNPAYLDRVFLVFHDRGGGGGADSPLFPP